MSSLKIFELSSYFLQEFLKKEFSHENIYFWAACERFHRLFPTDDAAIAATEAHKIFERHLGPTAGEPVNVDSQARQTAEENLSHPGPELFDQVHVNPSPPSPLSFPLPLFSFYPPLSFVDV